MSHLVAAVYRSHLNGTVFRRYPLRFTLVPLALFLAMGLSGRCLCTYPSQPHFGMSTIPPCRRSASGEFTMPGPEITQTKAAGSMRHLICLSLIVGLLG